MSLMRSGSLLTGFHDFLNWLPSGDVFVEIGAYNGESTELVAKSNKFKCIVTIDPYFNNYDATDPTKQDNMEEVRMGMYRKILPYPNVRHLNLTSDQAAALLADHFVDVVYIDGLHTYEATKKDILNYMPKVKRGGILAGHDYHKVDSYVWVRGVKVAVDEILGKPKNLFSDTSWAFKL